LGKGAATIIQEEKPMKKKKAIRIILHIIAWLMLLGLPLISSYRLQMGNDFLLIYYIFTIISGLIFYTNYLILVPKFFFQRRKYKYYLSVLVLVICFFFISNLSGSYIFNSMAEKREERFERSRAEGILLPPQSPPGRFGRFVTEDFRIIGYVSSASFMVFLSLGLKVLERQSEIEKQQEEMEKEKLNAELAFLKNQVSPHFFFNTLNNIYALIGIHAEDSQNAVLKLSKLMRYMLYESEHGDTKLSNEIDFMNNYIDLMKLRMSEKVSLTVDFPDANDDISMPPLLFIPFIENAFKHGITMRGRSYINIGISHSPEVLIFHCSNSIAGKRTEDSQPGIGLDNVKKRLALLYPGKHDLIIDRYDDEFRVFLNIKLT
jgi:two-component system, LytTR family, sensor kinase